MTEVQCLRGLTSGVAVVVVIVDIDGVEEGDGGVREARLLPHPEHDKVRDNDRALLIA